MCDRCSSTVLQQQLVCHVQCGVAAGWSERVEGSGVASKARSSGSGLSMQLLVGHGVTREQCQSMGVRAERPEDAEQPVNSPARAASCCSLSMCGVQCAAVRLVRVVKWPEDA